MSRDERRKRGRRLCRTIAERIGSFAAPGLGRWDTAWELVEGPSDRFLDFLRRWEASGHSDDEAALEAAAKDLVRAWHQADKAFRRQASGTQDSRPTPQLERAP